MVQDAPYLHAFVAKGSALLEEAGVLEAGDEVRLTRAGGRSFTAQDHGAEVLIWETNHSFEAS
jgi:hypothetical protein